MKDSLTLPELLRVEKSYEYAWASSLGMDLTFKRKRQRMGLEEFFGGLYLVARDSLALYWDQASYLDDFVREVCGLGDPIWLYWIDYYETIKSGRGEGFTLYTKSLGEILSHAATLALQKRKDSPKTVKLRVEHLMAALIAHRRLKFTRQLVASGLDLQKVNQTGFTA